MYALESLRLQPFCTIRAFGPVVLLWSRFCNIHVVEPPCDWGGGRMPAEAEGLPWVLSQAGLLSKIFSQSLKANPEGTSGQAPQYFSTTVEKEEVSSPCSTKSKARLEPRWWDEAGSRLRAAWGLGHCTHQLLLGGDSSRDGGKGHCTADTLRFTLQTSK